MHGTEDYYSIRVLFVDFVCQIKSVHVRHIDIQDIHVKRIQYLGIGGRLKRSDLNYDVCSLA